ncbi:MAG: hypothetical protein K0S71_2275 [Clostridia bacterium]|nr:hypothetical protein [Clostridia bacterium]
MNISMHISDLIEKRNETGYGNESIKEEVEARKQMEAFIRDCRLELPEEVAELFESYTRVIWQYQCPGMIHKFYSDETICHGEGGKKCIGSEAVLAGTIAHLRAFPDRRVHFVDIFVEGNEEDGYHFGQATRFIASNTGWSRYGEPTGKSLSRDGEWCHSICECHLKKVKGRWRVVEEWVVDSQEAIIETMTKDKEEIVEAAADCSQNAAEK